eukprot:scaffold2869_cov145-Skeletonema_menzelii.AAC.1
MGNALVSIFSLLTPLLLLSHKDNLTTCHQSGSRPHAAAQLVANKPGGKQTPLAANKPCPAKAKMKARVLKKKNRQHWGKVHYTNPILPEIPFATLNFSQQKQLQSAIDALPNNEHPLLRKFRINRLSQIIYFQGEVESKLSTEEDKMKFETWMVEIRETMYALHYPELAEYLYIVLIQTDEETVHPFVITLTLCPTAPNKDIPSQDISMLSSGDNLTGTNTVHFLQLLCNELSNNGNNYGGPMPNVINLNLQLICPAALRVLADLSADERSLFFDDAAPPALPPPTVPLDEAMLPTCHPFPTNNFTNMACEGGCCDNEVYYDSCHHSDTNNDGIIVTDGLSLHDTLLYTHGPPPMMIVTIRHGILQTQIVHHQIQMPISRHVGISSNELNHSCVVCRLECHTLSPLYIIIFAHLLIAAMVFII